MGTLSMRYALPASSMPTIALGIYTDAISAVGVTCGSMAIIGIEASVRTILIGKHAAGSEAMISAASTSLRANKSVEKVSPGL